jgi:hypothetical protein
MNGFMTAFSLFNSRELRHSLYTRPKLYPLKVCSAEDRAELRNVGTQGHYHAPEELMRTENAMYALLRR